MKQVATLNGCNVITIIKVGKRYYMARIPLIADDIRKRISALIKSFGLINVNAFTYNYAPLSAIPPALVVRTITVAVLGQHAEGVEAVKGGTRVRVKLTTVIPVPILVMISATSAISAVLARAGSSGIRANGCPRHVEFKVKMGAIVSVRGTDISRASHCCHPLTCTDALILRNDDTIFEKMRVANPAAIVALDYYFISESIAAIVRSSRTFHHALSFNQTTKGTGIVGLIFTNEGDPSLDGRVESRSCTNRIINRAIHVSTVGSCTQ